MTVQQRRKLEAVVQELLSASFREMMRREKPAAAHPSVYLCSHSNLSSRNLSSSPLPSNKICSLQPAVAAAAVGAPCAPAPDPLVLVRAPSGCRLAVTWLHGPGCSHLPAAAAAAEGSSEAEFLNHWKHTVQKKQQQEQEAVVGLNSPAGPGGLQALAAFAEVPN